VQNLPRATEQELRHLRREHERDRESAWERVRELEVRRWKRAMLEGAGLFLALNLYVFGVSLWAALLSPLFGALTGAGWTAARAEAVLSPLIAMPLYAALALFLRALGAGDGLDQAQALIFGTIAVGPSAMALGVLRSVRMAGD
jgi:hypothetical protein